MPGPWSTTQVPRGPNHVAHALHGWSRGSDRLLYHPSVAAGSGARWLVFSEYHAAEGRETLWLVDGRQERWVAVAERAGAILYPSCVVAEGIVWVCWVEAPRHEVVARPYDPARAQLGAKVRVSSSDRRCSFVEARPAGATLQLVWESWREDATNTIELARIGADGAVLARERLTPEGGVAYWPTCVATADALWLAWSSPNASRDGYDAYVTVARGTESHSVAQVSRLNTALDGNFHLYPELSSGADGVAWVTWLASTDHEYYDGTTLPGNSDFAYLQDARSRRLRNVWWKSCVPVVARLEAHADGLAVGVVGGGVAGSLERLGHAHYPTLLPNEGAVPRLAFRRLTLNLLFETVVAELRDGAWTSPTAIHEPSLQTGWNGPIAATFDNATNTTLLALQVHGVDAQDSFRWRPPLDSSVAIVELAVQGQHADEPLLQMHHLDAVTTAAAVAARAELASTPASSRASTLGTYFGNIHVHSEFSGCRRDTQQSLDLNFRWAKDLMQQDFHALTDHAEHLSSHDWSRTRAIANFYDFPGYFVTLPAYEWTVNDFGDTPHCGHCNVLLADIETARAYGSDDPETSTLEGLWAALPVGRAMTIPHHTATYPYLRDWELHNPDFERLVEVQQDRRGNYEYPGCPGEYGAAAPLQAKEHNHAAGFVVEALRRGYRLGLCAGGDHMGISMTGVDATGLTREAIYQGLWNRRCYGVTGAKIRLGLRVSSASQGKAVGMGGTVVVAPQGALSVEVHAEGAAALRAVDVISAGAVIQTFDAASKVECRHVFTVNPQETDGYLYVRALQADGEMAWSSPVWLNASGEQ